MSNRDKENNIEQEQNKSCWKKLLGLNPTYELAYLKRIFSRKVSK